MFATVHRLEFNKFLLPLPFSESPLPLKPKQIDDVFNCLEAPPIKSDLKLVQGSSRAKHWKNQLILLAACKEGTIKTVP